MPSAKLKREITFLKKDEIFIVTNRNHSVMEIAHRREHTPSWWIDLKDAAKFKFILSDHTTMLGTISRDLFHKEKLQYEVLHGNITADLAVSMAQEGLGLAFTYYSYTEPSRDAVFLSIGISRLKGYRGLWNCSRNYIKEWNDTLIQGNAQSND